MKVAVVPENAAPATEKVSCSENSGAFPKARAEEFDRIRPPSQRRIVAYLDGLQAKVDAVKKLQDETSEELNALVPSILSRVFSGEL